MAPGNDISIKASMLTRSFRRTDGQIVDALSAVSFDVLKGQFVCLIGPSGCGKTTLLQIIAGLLLPSSGTLQVGNEAVTGPSPERGMVFQKDSVFPWMRVIDNVQYGLVCRGMAPGERRAIAEHYLERVGLAHVAHAWPRELSGGMLKRVAVATVFANGAGVLLLDEPFGMLDYVTKRHLHDVLLTLWAETGGDKPRTVVFVTHDVDEALILADRIMVFHTGRLIDDILVGAPRPRTTDALLTPQMVEDKHLLLAHLGLEAKRAGATASLAR
ncbi:MAG: ABC transporter ATP-binding protein [Hyphomicrobiales bacterium]|nr:ABC transporter ATP-binding protein [Hyphomicrobiales bacterium]